MKHRMHAWVGAKKISCLADSIKSLHGKLDFSKTSMQHCTKKKCDKKCKKTLDLSKSINRKAPARAACKLPGKPCAAGGWSPTCAASLGTYRPIYRVGTRTSSVCSVARAAVRLKARITKCSKCVKTPTWTKRYRRVPKGCGGGKRLALYANRSNRQCADLCWAKSSCLAYEYSVVYAGASLFYKPRDCQLLASSKPLGCKGKKYNQDLYVKLKKTR